MDAQQGLHGKGRLAPMSALWGIGFNERDQLSPGHHQLHGIEELPLARALGGVAQAQASLLHAHIAGSSGMLKHISGGFVQRIPRETVFFCEL